jgi:uncharacterized membrane protein
MIRAKNKETASLRQQLLDETRALQACKNDLQNGLSTNKEIASLRQKLDNKRRSVEAYKNDNKSTRKREDEHRREAMTEKHGRWDAEKERDKAQRKVAYLDEHLKRKCDDLFWIT